MIAHLRTYTINKGMMDGWLELFHEKIVPLLDEAGIKVESAWVNDERPKAMKRAARRLGVVRRERGRRQRGITGLAPRGSRKRCRGHRT